MGEALPLRRWRAGLRAEKLQLLYPATVPCWLEPVSLVGSWFFTTFLGSFPGLALPSDPSARTALMLAVTLAPHGEMAVPADEAPGSQALHTARFLRPHVLVGYWWQNPR